MICLSITIKENYRYSYILSNFFTAICDWHFLGSHLFYLNSRPTVNYLDHFPLCRWPHYLHSWLLFLSVLLYAHYRGLFPFIILWFGFLRLYYDILTVLFHAYVWVAHFVGLWDKHALILTKFFSWNFRLNVADIVCNYASFSICFCVLFLRHPFVLLSTRIT